MSSLPEVYGAADLAEGGEVFKKLSPPARLCIFGDPVAQSASPWIQNAALKARGLDLQYVRIRVTAAELSDALLNLIPAGFLGASLTMPHKQAALPLMDQVDREARLMGAINTVVIRGEKLHGHNTDGPGFSAAVRESFAVPLSSLRVLILGGSGGAGRAITVQCALEGCPSITVANRNREKGDAISSEIREALARVGLSDPRVEVRHASEIVSMDDDPAVARPAFAKAEVDLDGHVTRAHADATTMREAIDLVVPRLRRRLEERRHRAAQRHLRQQRANGRHDRADDHHWRHGDRPAPRPSYFPRPTEEREVVRHKTFAVVACTPDEAAADLEALDHAFYLFVNATKGMERMGYADVGAFAEVALHNTGVSFCTRRHFGRPQPGETEQYIRLAYSGIDTTDIVEGLTKLKNWMSK